MSSHPPESALSERVLGASRVRARGLFAALTAGLLLASFAPPAPHPSRPASKPRTQFVAGVAGVERGPGADPTDERAPEYKLKAAYLFHFLRYTTWPDEAFENANQPIEVVLIGKDHFGGLLEKTFGSKKLHGRKVVINRHARVPETLHGHLIYTCELPEQEELRLVAELRERPILLVSDRADMAERGAGASFYLEKNKLRFAINTAIVKAQKLAMSSELLKLARIVDKSGGAR